ncbi:alpha/beta fold hydrolase [Paenibacillus silviterrae]|uniref:alpha/beta fold hydrolase n=1 Tax=Paenibacillus silviterrae TaxID=3242194 RepID=UPI002542E61C|nr:alpha/beta hydrolase [Paenibacillus chinjuensis]
MKMSIIQRNNVQIKGSGEMPMIFAHGFGCDQHMWRFVAPAFESDYRTILFDYVGSGKSDWGAYNPERYKDLAGYAQDLLDVCEAAGMQKGIFVGHSVSAMIGILAAIREPSLFSRLILIGPSPCFINEPPDYIGGFERKDIEELIELMSKNYKGWANFLAPIVMANPDQPELARELEESFCAMDPQIAISFARATFLSDYRQELSKVNIPALILQCDQDAIAPLEVGAFVHYQMPQSTLQLMQATGHCPHISHPEETIQLIKQYLCTSFPDSSESRAGHG